MTATWATVSSLATGAGTLVLAVATFASVRSANRAARVAERALQVGLRPLLVSSRLDDPPQKIFFGGGHHVLVPGANASVEMNEDIIYLAISIRNAGNGLGLVQGWQFAPGRIYGSEQPDSGQFRLQTRDMYVAPGDLGFWQAAVRDPADQWYPDAVTAVKGDAITIDVLYSDHEGNQPAISRFLVQRSADDKPWLATNAHHWNVGRPNPR